MRKTKLSAVMHGNCVAWRWSHWDIGPILGQGSVLPADTAFPGSCHFSADVAMSDAGREAKAQPL